MASFEYDFEYEDDMVYFAYCIPYTYTMLLSFLKELSANDKKPLHHNKGTVCLIDKLNYFILI